MTLIISENQTFPYVLAELITKDKDDIKYLESIGAKQYIKYDNYHYGFHLKDDEFVKRKNITIFGHSSIMIVDNYQLMHTDKTIREMSKVIKHINDQMREQIKQNKIPTVINN